MLNVNLLTMLMLSLKVNNTIGEKPADYLKKCIPTCKAFISRVLATDYIHILAFGRELHLACN